MITELDRQIDAAIMGAKINAAQKQAMIDAEHSKASPQQSLFDVTEMLASTTAAMKKMGSVKQLVTRNIEQEIGYEVPDPDEVSSLEHSVPLAPDPLVIAVAKEICKKAKMINPLTYFKEYEEFIEEGLKKLKADLELNFPDRWDLVVKGSTAYYAKEIGNAIANSSTLQEAFIKYTDLNGSAFYDIVIHFPVINITNGRNNHVIKDMYIMLNLGYSLTMTGSLHGFRATKNSREYSSNYNHSHAQKGNNNVVGFCLGSTALDALVTELRTMSFNDIKYALLFQQLPDYLAWESRDGGPYSSIEEFAKTQQGTPRAPIIDDSAMANCYRTFIRSRPDVELNIVTNEAGRIDRVDVLQTDALWADLTDCVPYEFKFPCVEGRHISVYPIQDGSMTNQDIIYQNSRIGNSPWSYKKKRLKLQIELNDTTAPVSQIQVDLFADHRILQYVVDEMSIGITKHVQDVYWHGIEQQGSIS